MGIHDRIRKLERDLDADIYTEKRETTKIYRQVHPDGTLGAKRKFHTEERGETAPGEEVRLVEESITRRIPKPDPQKRKDAKQELQQIYDNTKWYQKFVRLHVWGVLRRAGYRNY